MAKAYGQKVSTLEANKTWELLALPTRKKIQAVNKVELKDDGTSKRLRAWWL